VISGQVVGLLKLSMPQLTECDDRLAGLKPFVTISGYTRASHGLLQAAQAQLGSTPAAQAPTTSGYESSIIQGGNLYLE
jgi:hypothetical protein